MPASYTEALNPIEESLRASLGNNNNNRGEAFEQQLAASSVKVLLHDIDFEPAQKSSSFQLQSLKSKYILLNPNATGKNHLACGEELKMSVSKDVLQNEDGIPVPKVDLFPAENISLEWHKIRKIGAGLQNMGNTCFLNSTLQCLTYTAPLVSYLETEDHPSKCKIVGFCMVCELQRHLKRCFENNSATIRPHSILVKLKYIAKHMQWGRQEDAHEFLRYLVDAMQKACLNGFNKLDRYSKETTVINRIFGGFLRSQVQCLRCKERSNTYDPFQDISLDIKNVPNMQKAFEKFVQPETLDCDNAYNCPRCKHKGSATKRFTLHRASNVLTIQLKRFDYNRFFGGKISRHITFTERFDIRPYMSSKQGEPMVYHLYGVLVHSGSSCNSGHYYCYVKAPNQTWYCMNDSSVSQVSIHRVLSSEAYLLFYMKATQTATSNHIAIKTVNGPSLPVKSMPAALGSSSSIVKNGATDNDLGTSIERIKIGPQLPPSQKQQQTPRIIPVPNKREKISFGINLVQKPRIVLNIKKNSSGYTVENGKPTLAKKSPLVPYDSDSDQDKSSPASLEESTDKTVLTHSTPKATIPLKSSSISSESCIDNRTSKERESLSKFDTIGNIFTNITKSEPFVASSVKNSVNEMNKPFSEPLSVMNTPVKRTLSSDQQLTCITTPPKVNATTPWHVLCKDSQVSPSIGSESSNISNTSANSTTEWKVDDKLESPRTSSGTVDRSAVGWIVTPNGTVKSSKRKKLHPIKLKRENSDSNSQDDSEENNNCVSSNNKAESHLKTEVENVAEVPQLNVEEHESVMISTKTDLDTNSEDDNCDDGGEWAVKLSPQLLADGANDEVDENAEKVKKKRRKKHKRKKDEDYVYDEDEESEDGCSAHKKHKKKKHKHKHRHRHQREDGEVVDEPDENDKHDSSFSSESQESSKKKKDEKKIYEWVEKTKEKIVKKEYTNKRGAEEDMNKYRALAEVEKFMAKPMLPRSILPKIGHKSRKTKEKANGETNNKHSKVETEEVKVDAQQQRPSQEKEEEKEEGEMLDEVITDSQPKPAQNLYWDDKDYKTRRHHHHRNHSYAPATYWDQHCKDGYKRQNSNDSHIGSNRFTWDGTRGSSVVDELQKNSIHGFGNAVNSWNGGQSVIDKEDHRDRSRENKRSWTDDYDDEIDHGKVKKVRKESQSWSHKNARTYGYNAGNPYQRYHDNRSRDKNRSYDGAYGQQQQRSSYGNYHQGGGDNRNRTSYHQGGYNRDRYY